jgi:hypothetical protein
LRAAPGELEPTQLAEPEFTANRKRARDSTEPASISHLGPESSAPVARGRSRQAWPPADAQQGMERTSIIAAERVAGGACGVLCHGFWGSPGAPNRAAPGTVGPRSTDAPSPSSAVSRSWRPPGSIRNRPVSRRCGAVRAFCSSVLGPGNCRTCFWARGASIREATCEHFRNPGVCRARRVRVNVPCASPRAAPRGSSGRATRAQPPSSQPSSRCAPRSTSCAVGSSLLPAARAAQCRLSRQTGPPWSAGRIGSAGGRSSESPAT